MLPVVPPMTVAADVGFRRLESAVLGLGLLEDRHQPSTLARQATNFLLHSRLISQRLAVSGSSGSDHLSIVLSGP